MKYIKYFESNSTLEPSDFFKIQPMGSIIKKGEAETIAKNIMVILYRTGNKFRNLSWEEYKKERLKDGYFSEEEKMWFDLVIDYCINPEKAKIFSKYWNVLSKTEIDAQKYNL